MDTLLFEELVQSRTQWQLRPRHEAIDILGL
jgi:hypothetical protein